MLHDMRDTLHEFVASEVRAEMARKRMSGAALARSLDVSPQWVSYRLSGQVPFDVAELARVAEVLGVEVSQFLAPAARAS